MKNVKNPFYVCKKYFLLIYETQEKAVAAVAAAHWSKELKSRVTYSNPGEPIFVIKKEDKFWHVIIGEHIGWIIVESWLEIKTLQKQR